MSIQNNIFSYNCKNKNWTKIEEQFLKIFVNKYGSSNWKKISYLFFHKNSADCLKRWWYWINPVIKKSKWDKIEDKKISLIQMRIFFRFSIIFIILRRSNLQVYFRLKFIQKARQFFRGLVQKNIDIDNENCNYIRNNLVQNVLFYSTILKYGRLNYVKIKLNFINKNKKKYYSHIIHTNYLRNYNFLFKKYFNNNKKIQYRPKKIVYLEIIFFLTFYNSKMLEFDKLVSLNIFYKVLKSNKIILYQLINNRYIHLGLREKIVLIKFKKI